MTQLSVEKKVKAVSLAIEKTGITYIPPCKVGMALDVSYSAKWMFENGMMQTAFNQLLGAAVKLDDDGQLDAWVFDDSKAKITTANAEDYDTFIKAKLLKSGAKMWGGTHYAPVINEIVGEFFLGKPAQAAVKPSMFGGLFAKKVAPAPAASNDPAVVFFLTDGDNQDQSQAEAALAACANKPIYIFMVGVGTATTFPWIQKMADKYDHVGFIAIRDLNISDEAMYAALFTEEFAAYAKKIGGK